MAEPRTRPPATTPEDSAAPFSALLVGGVAQRLRIGTGLILFLFALFHFLNHALGIWSVEAMDAAQAWRTAVTRSAPGTIVLAAALVVHVVLSVAKVLRRSTWRMPRWEALQIAFGLAIPVLLLPHIAAQRGAHEIEGAATRYSEVLGRLWTDAGWQQSLLLVIVWVHGCIGLHYWLRLNAWYRRMAPALLVLAVLVPSLALAGFVAAGRDAVLDIGATQPVIAAETGATTAAADRPTVEDLQLAAGRAGLVLIGLVTIVLGARALLALSRRRIRVRYTGGPVVTSPVGPTLLEISRVNGVAHAAVCGGRARCSTCRVKIEASAHALPAPARAEATTLRRIHAEDGVRLACQIRPRGDVTVTRLVLFDERRALTAAHVDDVGVERTLAILFLDIRGFTALSDARLPYDTVFLLNRFFAEVGEAIAAAGGWIDKYLGDGLMALFGLNQRVEDGSRAALDAAMRFDVALTRLNADLSGELGAPLRVGIGLHVGPLVLGRIGHSASASTTVIGPAVNVASRLEALTKELGVQVVVSGALAAHAGIPRGAFPETAVTVRGASSEMPVLLIDKGRDLEPLLRAPASRTAG